MGSDCSDGKAKRRIIGEEILKKIRFPLMSLEEFASFVVDSNILNIQELGVMIKHYGQVPTPLPYLQSPRTGALKRICRFKNFKKHPSSGTSGGWTYSGKLDSLILSVDKVILLHGVQHFGREGGDYTVSMEIKDITTDLSASETSGLTYSCEKDLDNVYYGFDVLFDTPVILQSRKIYKIISKISGPSSWYGEEGETEVKFEGINFTFSAPESPNNGTHERRGQFPVFLFTHSG